MNLDGSEDYHFIWPKQPDLILIEDIPNKKEVNNDQKIDFFFQGKIGNDDEYDEEEDILFGYDRYNISSIRKEVLNDLLKKKELNSEMDIEEDDYHTKDYDYYNAFGLIE